MLTYSLFVLCKKMVECWTILSFHPQRLHAFPSITEENPTWKPSIQGQKVEAVWQVTDVGVKICCVVFPSSNICFG